MEMTFADFCGHLAKIEATPKRLEMTSLLAELLKQADTQEVNKVVTLALGRLAPLYKDIDFGMAEKTIIRSLAVANGVETDILVRMFKKLGDLGEVAFKLKTPAFASRSTRSAGLTGRFSADRQKSKISVIEVFEKLMEIAAQSGEGSQEKKVNKTADLLRELDPLGAKYAVRIILQNLRLGFSDKTVLDALSVMIAGDKSAREKLEQAYNVKPDVGWLAKQVKSEQLTVNSLRNVKLHGLTAVASPPTGLAGAEPRTESHSSMGLHPWLSGAWVKPKLGIPIMPALCQRLPTAEEIINKMEKVALEPKWDGQRIQAHAWIQRPKAKGRRLKENQEKKVNIKLFTRSLEDVTSMFPDLVNAFHSLIQHSLPAAATCPPVAPPASLREALRAGGAPGACRRAPHLPALPTAKPLQAGALQAGTFNIQNCILDGEIVAINPKTNKILPFQTMITRKRKYGIQEKLADVPVKYIVFDILYLNGKSLMDEEFTARRRILERSLLALRQGDSSLNAIIQLAPQVITSSPAEIRKFLKLQTDSGLEGIVAKRTAAPYIPGRTKFAWVKLKWEGAAKSGGLLDTVDCVVMGTYAGRGKRAGFGVGAFLVGIYSPNSLKFQNSPISFLTLSKIGTGLTDKQWRELKAKGQRLKAKGKPKEYEVPKELTPDTWLRPELVAEIQADNITKSPLHSAGYALRFPRLVRYRNDKNPDQATTLEEIKKLYQMSLKH